MEALIVGLVIALLVFLAVQEARNVDYTLYGWDSDWVPDSTPGVWIRAERKTVNIGMVVGKQYRNLGSVSRYIERSIGKDDTLVFLAPAETPGEALAMLVASRIRRETKTFYVGETPLSHLKARVDLVKSIDRLVLFDDGGLRAEHIYNLAEVNKVPMVHFREVKDRFRR